MKANTTLKLMDMDTNNMFPGTTFVGARKLRNGGILYQLNTSNAGSWLSQTEVQKAFIACYGNTTNI